MLHRNVLMLRSDIYCLSRRPASKHEIVARGFCQMIESISDCDFQANKLLFLFIYKELWQSRRRLVSKVTPK